MTDMETAPRTLALIAALLLISVPLLAAPVGVTVVVENRAPDNGTWLTPPWVSFHDGSFDLFDTAAAAGPTLERLAEDGNAGPLQAMFDAAAGTGAQGLLPAAGAMPQLAPGESVSRTFVLDASDPANRFLGYASMVIPSNDAFVGNDDPQAHRVFDNAGNFLGGFVMLSGGDVRDAGTEVNDEVPAHTAFFGQTSPDTGDDQNGTVQAHPGFLPAGSDGILDDPDFAMADFTDAGYQVATITLYRSDTIVPGGSVSGTWTADGSPYIVQGDVTVPAGATLSLEPGVVVYTEAGHEITVQGTLEAPGTEEAPIVFTGPASGWGGLRIDGLDAVALLEHGTVEHGDRLGTYDEGGGLACYGGTLTLRSCKVVDNAAFLDGAGIYALDADVTIEDSEIGRNLIDGSNSAAGGGLYAENCRVQITGSRFHHNRVETFTFFGATNSHGGGLALEQSGGTVERCLVDGNYVTHSGTEAESLGGGIYVYADFQEDLLLRNNTVTGNTVNYTNAHGGGIYITGYDAELLNNLVTGNTGHGIWFDGGGQTADVSYNDVWNNSAGNYGGGYVPAGVGSITQDNANGDPCDAFFNISENPLYTAPVQDDYTLMFGSPCIDAGDPASPTDPDGTVADIGAFHHPQVASGVDHTTHGTRLSMLLPAQPAPMTAMTTIAYRLPADRRVRLAVYDLRGREVRTLVDGVQRAGERTVAFDGHDADGRDLPSGTYLYRLQADGRNEVRKIAILR